MLVLFFLAMVPQSAFAHASLIETTPQDGAVLDAAPGEVTLSFTEPVGLVDDGYRLFGEDGLIATLEARVSESDVVLTMPETVPDGSYVVDWRVISMDTHPIDGTVVFAVGEAGAAGVAVPDGADISPVVGAVQGVGYVTLLASVGLLWFRAFVIGAIERATFRIAAVAGGVAIVAYGLLIPLTSARAAGASADAVVDAEMWRVGFSHPTVQAVGLMATGLIVMLLFATRGGVPGNGVMLGGVIALASLSLVGHTESVEPAALMYASDLVHGIAGAVWFGGLIGLARYLWRDGRGDPASGARILTRFSLVAGLAFAAAAVTGSVMAFRIVDGFDALTGTTYGRLLMVKVAVLLVPFGLATWNRLRLVPAVKRAPDTASAWARLRGSVAVESMMLVVVLGVTGFMVLQNPVVDGADPARVAQSAAPWETTAELDGGTVTVRISPGTVGENEIGLDIRDRAGAPMALVNDPVVELSLPDEGLGPITVVVPATETEGTYAGPVRIPLSGTWEVTITARVSRFEAPSTTVTMPVP